MARRPRDAFMNAELEPRHITSPQMADVYEMVAGQAIEAVTDPDEAQRLLDQTRAIEGVVKALRFSHDRQRRWGVVELRAERKYGELLGPAKHGGDRKSKSDQVSSADLKSTDTTARSQARKVAAVQDWKFEEYVADADTPTRAGLLRAAGKRKPPGNPKASPETHARVSLEKKNLGDPEYVVRRLTEEVAPTVLAEAVRLLQKGLPKARRGNWDGKTNLTRERELRVTRKDNPGLAGVLTNVNKLCMALESLRSQDFTGQAADPWAISMVLDDLISLDEWLGRTVSGVQGWLQDGDVRKKIATLRDTSGRTPEEAAAAQAVANRLERSLDRRLTA